MAKSLCKWKKKEIAAQLADLKHLVEKPRFICSDCARAANDKSVLCKPNKIK